MFNCLSTRVLQWTVFSEFSHSTLIRQMPKSEEGSQGVYVWRSEVNSPSSTWRQQQFQNNLFTLWLRWAQSHVCDVIIPHISCHPLSPSPILSVCVTLYNCPTKQKLIQNHLLAFWVIGSSNCCYFPSDVSFRATLLALVVMFSLSPSLQIRN